MSGPFATSAAVVKRTPYLFQTQVTVKPGVQAHRFWAADTLEDSYGTLADSGLAGDGGVAFLEVRALGYGLTPTPEAQGVLLPSRRSHPTGCSVAMIDPRDVSIADVAISDENLWFLRLQERFGGAWRGAAVDAVKNVGVALKGAIQLMLPTHYYGQISYVISLQSKAPTKTGCVAGSPPTFDETLQVPHPIYLVLPKPANTITMTALDQDVLVSYGSGMPMTLVKAGTSSIPTGGGFSGPGVREILFATAGDGAVCANVTLEMTLSNEII